MQLDWLGEYRTFIEKLIKFGNAYAATYQKEQSFGTTKSFSSSQLQTMEYILENEEKNQTMKEIAERLGISPSSFSKNVKKMIEKGLLEKYQTEDNKKNIIVKVSPLGKAVYSDYCDYVKKGIINDLKAKLSDVPKENIDIIAEAIDMWANDLNRQPTAPKGTQNKPVLIKIE